MRLTHRGQGRRLDEGRSPHHLPEQYAHDELFLSMLDRVGVHAEILGDSTGKLQQLF